MNPIKSKQQHGSVAASVVEPDTLRNTPSKQPHHKHGDNEKHKKKKTTMFAFPSPNRPSPPLMIVIGFFGFILVFFILSWLLLPVSDVLCWVGWGWGCTPVAVVSPVVPSTTVVVVQPPQPSARQQQQQTLMNPAFVEPHLNQHTHHVSSDGHMLTDAVGGAAVAASTTLTTPTSAATILSSPQNNAPLNTMAVTITPASDNGALPSIVSTSASSGGVVLWTPESHVATSPMKTGTIVSAGMYRVRLP